MIVGLKMTYKVKVKKSREGISGRYLYKKNELSIKHLRLEEIKRIEIYSIEVYIL